MTALAAHGVSEQGQESVVFFSQSVDGESQFMRVRVPAPASLGGVVLEPVALQDAAGQPLRFFLLDGSGQQLLNGNGKPVPAQVVALVVLLKLPGEAGWELGVATRTADGRGNAFLLALNEQGAAEVAQRTTLDFGGPVRALVTHAAGRFPAGEEETPKTPPAGARIWLSLSH